MNDTEKLLGKILEYFVSVLPISLIIGLIIAFFVVKYYDKLQIIAADLLRLFGWLGKIVRKKSLESEYEGIINGAITDFNNNFDSPILPKCEIEWIDSKNQRNVIRKGKAILCLNFDKRDHDLNFYNATYNFVKTGLLHKAKPFLRNTTSKSIDLLSTKIILRDYRRNILRIFNEKFKEEENQIKEVFYRLEETDQRGLYSTILVPECHHLGEILDTKTPSAEIEAETENFLDWFYNLATREHDERTTLSFSSPNIRVGVILVAKLSTYDKFGTEAYTRWAEKYASENYGAVYLLARGKKRAGIAKKIAKELTDTDGFQQFNKKTDLILSNEDGSRLTVTCISLKPNIAAIQYNAWEKLKKNYKTRKNINAIIESISKDQVIVNIYGIKAVIDSKNLSSQQIPDCKRLFKVDQELVLKIERFNPDEQDLVLSNVDTETDPKLIIDAVLKNNAEVSVKIIRLLKANEGIVAICEDLDIKIFIPRSYATRSRFTDLHRAYSTDQVIKVRLIEFAPAYGNFIGTIADLRDPWQSKNISKYSSGQIVNAVVQEITPNYISCEIEEGLECRVYKSEYSWNEKECNSAQFSLGQQIELKILNIDTGRLRIDASIKQIKTSPNELFSIQNRGQVLEGKVTKITEGIGLSFTNSELGVFGFVPLRELMWAFCNQISDHFSIGDNIRVKVIDYKKDADTIWFSVKRCFENNFSEFIKDARIGDVVKGKVLHRIRDIIRIQLDKSGVISQAYIHKSEISTIAFLDDSDLDYYLSEGWEFYFTIKRIDRTNQVIELSRKSLLHRNLKELNYDSLISGTLTKITNDRCFFYSEKYEGFIALNNAELKFGQTINARPINIATKEFEFINVSANNVST